jgi:hypothetical protein
MSGVPGNIRYTVPASVEKAVALAAGGGSTGREWPA